MANQLLNMIENQVSWFRTDDAVNIAIPDFDPSNARKATLGTGVFYFYNEGWNSDLSFRLANALSLSTGPSQIGFTIDRLSQFPCSGILTSSNEGYLIAPAAKIEVARGPNIAFMLLAPRTIPHRVALNKSSLSIPDVKARLDIFLDGNQLHCIGKILDSNFQTARLIVNRNPNLPVYRDGYNDELCKLAGPGEIDVTWKPVMRSFEEILVVFYPSSVGAPELSKVARSLGALPSDFGDADSAMVVGDGLFTNYALRLVVDHHFRRSQSDETTLTVA